MRSRVPASVLLLLLLSLPASGVLLSPLPDEPLTQAAERLKARDYRSAHDLALKSREGGVRDFVAGYAAYRSASYGEATGLLERATATYPLLGEYAQLYRADALYRTEKYNEALAATRKVLKEHPDSILKRQIILLEADILFARKEWQPALTAYLTFIDKYASGSDSVTALSKGAACKECLGEKDAAAGFYRSIWLNYPASPVATTAGEHLKRLTAAGARVAPYNREELFHRASTLSDLRQYDAALAALEALPVTTMDEEFTSHILLKKGQTLFKLRRYQDAGDLMNRIATAGAPQVRDEALYWQSRSLDKIGKDEEASRIFLHLADTFPKSSLADDALMQAALIRKDQRNMTQSLSLLDRMLTTYPRSDLRQRALWESGWALYLSGAYPAAIERFRSLAESPEVREKALYWLGRCHEATSNRENAATVFAMLYKEYPAGFYTVRYLKSSDARDRLTSSADFTQTIPVPAGYERIKALITLGLVDEARLELSAERKKLGKQKSALGLARLFLELGDFKTPMGLAKYDTLSSVTTENLRLWNLSFPLPYREPVTEQVQRTGLPESLVYAVMRTESSFSTTVLSPAGAVGLMQLMPATAKEVSKKGRTFNAAELTRPDFNISCGAQHLKDLLKQHDNSLVLAVAAYNAGSGPVNRWRKRFGTLREDEFIENIPYGETREYVKKVLASAELYHRIYNLQPALFATISSTRMTSRL
jgi:soluble lytic murein transglycosylase